MIETLLLLAATTTPSIPSTPDLGKAEAACRANENGPSFLVNIAGLKDMKGRLKLEVYPSNDKDFLADDNVLISEGKTFRRVEIPTRDAAPAICVRVPGPGTYSLMVLHDRNSDRKFSLNGDGIGFAANPRLGTSKPKASKASAKAGSGPTPITIVMNYRTGLFSFTPLKKKR